MHSEFYNVALDRLRYSLVWEDSATLYAALAITPTDRLLLITSAGCNVLNTLLKAPRQVVAIDLNPVQNRLLRLKMHAIQHHDPSVLRGMMGLDGSEQVRAATGALWVTLPTAERTYWQSFFASHPEGILTAGKLEAYITGFYSTLDADTQQRLRHLLTFTDVMAQARFVNQELHGSRFQAQFIAYFDDANLSKGRAPELFTYAQESGGEAFYKRLHRQLTTTLAARNFFLRFFFFGPRDLPEALLPPCYQVRHHASLRVALPRLTMVDGEAVDYLLSAAGASINKASLSNIFEYISQAEFRRVSALLARRDSPLRFVFWNLLQVQGAHLAADGWQDVMGQNPPLTETACFYFQGHRAVQVR